METLGLSGRKSPVQTVLILLVESGLVFLGFQVSDFCTLLADTVLFRPTLQSLVTGVPELKRFSELSRITTGFEEIFPGTRKMVKRIP